MKSRIGWRPLSCLVTSLLAGGLLTAEAAEIWQFREPKASRYVTEMSAAGLQSLAVAPAVLEVHPEGNPAQKIDLTRQLVVRWQNAEQAAAALAKARLRTERRIDERTFVLEATDAWASATEAARLAALPEVEVATPIFRRKFTLNGAYAPRSNDTYLPNQWHLENRDAEGDSGGADINIRAAWPLAKGAGVTVAVVDIGVQVAHPDLVARTTGAPHRNFASSSEDGNPLGTGYDFAHGTAVAGLITAETGNGIGVAGLAPEAKLASWLIFTNAVSIVDENKLAQMFSYRTDAVGVQNHSWGALANQLQTPSFLESVGIGDAVTAGRNGHGVVIVRAAGNHRQSYGNVNDDGYASSPDVIAVGAVGVTGRVASYGSRGACILVSAPGGDGSLTLVTTDLTGTGGRNFINFGGDQNNYGFGGSGFNGTSGSTPVVSGIVALMLSANPELNLRDVQHILVQSARHFDFADPVVQTNGAGFITSENVGFGIPDAGVAVKLAQTWSNQPPRTVAHYSNATGIPIPEFGARVEVTGPDTPTELLSVQAYASDFGPRADKPTPDLPLVFAGYATNAITTNLQGKAALIQRGPGRDQNNTNLTFAAKIKRAADAGAQMAVIFSDSNTVEQVSMGVDEFSPIPAVFINREPGLALTNYVYDTPGASARIATKQAAISFSVTNELVCEHVGVRLSALHNIRRDLRITLISPAGTVSVLQFANTSALNITGSGPSNWTHYSTQNFYEPAKGRWTIQMTDEVTDDTGLFTDAELIIHGIPITDSDADGLDDGWEAAKFGNLAQGPKDDPDADGWQNAREQVRGTDPNVSDEPFALDVSYWNQNFLRLSWPVAAGQAVAVQKFTGSGITPVTLTNVTGKFPVTECFVPYTNTANGFFRLQKNAP